MTKLDRAVQSKDLFLGFAGVITAVSAWMIWGGGDMFPKQEVAKEPVGEPEQWTEAELKKYLGDRGVSLVGANTKADLVTRVRAVR